MKDKSNSPASGNPLVRGRFVLVSAAILVIGALSMLALWDYDLLEWAEDSGGNAGKGPSLALANPASVNCSEKGGASEIRDSEKGQTGYCRFPDGRVCEEWALLRDGRCTPPE